MAAESREQSARLIESLASRPGDFEFFQAVRLLELRPGAASDHSPVGYDAGPQEELLRFHVAPSLASQPSTVRSIDPPPAASGDDATASGPVHVHVGFFGTVGPAGTLPQHYTELAIRRVQLKDAALRDFLDIFHHRALSFFFRAWRKYRLPIAREYAKKRGKGGVESEDGFSLAVRSLVGRGTHKLGSERASDLRTWTYFSGLFGDSRRSLDALANLLSEILDAPVAIEPFFGRWLDIPLAERTTLPPRERSPMSGLGCGAMLGSRVWDVQSKIKVRAGPVSRAKFEALLPGSPLLERFAQALSSYVDGQVDFAIEIDLSRNVPRPLRLGGSEKLGRDSWLAITSRGARMDTRVPLFLDSARPA